MNLSVGGELGIRTKKATAQLISHAHSQDENECVEHNLLTGIGIRFPIMGV